MSSLQDCAGSLGFSALYALHGGEWVPFTLGASDSVNRSFFELFPGGLPPPDATGHDHEERPRPVG